MPSRLIAAVVRVGDAALAGRRAERVRRGGTASSETAAQRVHRTRSKRIASDGGRSKRITSLSTRLHDVAEQEDRSGDDDARRDAPRRVERVARRRLDGDRQIGATRARLRRQRRPDRPSARSTRASGRDGSTAGSSAANMPARVLVAHRARRPAGAASGLPLVEIGRERGRAGRVVRRVEQHLAAVGQDAARSSRPGQPRPREAVRDRRARNGDAAARSTTSSSADRDGRVRRSDGRPAQADREAAGRRAAPSRTISAPRSRATAIDHGDGVGAAGRRRRPARRA